MAESRIESQLNAVISQTTSDIVPQSRSEEIIKSMIDGTSYDKPPESRLEELLLQLKNSGGGGGGPTIIFATDEQVRAKLYGE